MALEFYLKGKKLFFQETNTEKRGLVEHENSLCFTKPEYNADYAQIKAEYEMSTKGLPL